MPSYVVKIPEVHIVSVEVEAESPDAAKAKANERLEEGTDDLYIEYSHTKDMWDWDVEEVS